MKKAIDDIANSEKKSGPGRPRLGVPVLVRLREEQIEALDEWCGAQKGSVSRAEGLRRLIDTHPAMRRKVS